MLNFTNSQHEIGDRGLIIVAKGFAILVGKESIDNSGTNNSIASVQFPRIVLFG